MRFIRPIFFVILLANRVQAAPVADSCPILEVYHQCQSAEAGACSAKMQHWLNEQRPDYLQNCKPADRRLLCHLSEASCDFYSNNRLDKAASLAKAQRLGLFAKNKIAKLWFPDTENTQVPSSNTLYAQGQRQYSLDFCQAEASAEPLSCWSVRVWQNWFCARAAYTKDSLQWTPPEIVCWEF